MTLQNRLRPFLCFMLIAGICFAQASTTASTSSDPPAPSVTSTAQFDGQFLVGSGAGFKPYQTSVKNGSSAFVEGGWQFATGLFSFVRVDMRSTDAQMMIEGCKSLFSSTSNLLMLCGGPGFGADANNVGISFTGGGKWFFAPKALAKESVWIAIEMGVDKTTVPAPVVGSSVVSPVQPDFRVGIFKKF